MGVIIAVKQAEQAHTLGQELEQKLGERCENRKQLYAQGERSFIANAVHQISSCVGTGVAQGGMLERFTEDGIFL
jgi:hypothetical protein